MAQIRHISISNFRCVEQLDWFPAGGINCLIGPGDAGKSSILDAIDFCLGARRTVQFTDADFHGLNVVNPIVIRITIGDLADALKSMETYGAYLRGYDATKQVIDDEPETGKETVLTVQLTVGSDLDPVWTLVSDRAQAQGLSRNLTWGDRTRLSPTRIGAVAESNLAWRRGSVLNRLTEEKADTSAALASAARDARKAFGNLADAQLGETLKIVAETARELGIPAGDTLKAMLDAHSVSFSGGTVALHGDDGVPLRALGVGRRGCWSPASSARRPKSRASCLSTNSNMVWSRTALFAYSGQLGLKRRRRPFRPSSRPTPRSRSANCAVTSSGSFASRTERTASSSSVRLIRFKEPSEPIQRRSCRGRCSYAKARARPG